MQYERIRNYKAKGTRQFDTGQATASYGGREESKSALDVQVHGPAGSTESADGIEMKLNTEITITSSFVDDSSVLVKYLEGVIDKGCKSSAVFSYLISLYIKLEDEQPLLTFLQSQLPSSLKANSGGTVFGQERGGPLDKSFALRAVLGSGRHFRSAIKLYMGFGMRQQAVELALKVDPSLARDIAQESVEIDERKRLWLMIAKHAAVEGSNRGKNVVARVVGVLKSCGPDVLSIEDVLPFLYVFSNVSLLVPSTPQLTHWLCSPQT